MKLTSEQEEQLIQQYDKLLWYIVHHFRRRNCRGGFDNSEDLHSECVLVFISHIRSCKTMEDVRKIPFCDMVHAMCFHVLREQTVSYPKRTTGFGKLMENPVGRTDLSELEFSSSDGRESMGDVLDRATFENYFRQLPPRDQKIVHLKLEGKKNCEVARDLGLTDVAVTRALKRLRKIYQCEAA